MPAIYSRGAIGGEAEGRSAPGKTRECTKTTSSVMRIYPPSPTNIAAARKRGGEKGSKGRKRQRIHHVIVNLKGLKREGKLGEYLALGNALQGLGGRGGSAKDLFRSSNRLNLRQV